VIYATTKFLGPFEGYDISITCPSGKHVLSGDFYGSSAGTDKSYPFTSYDLSGNGEGWKVAGAAGAFGGYIIPFAICAIV
jgi:hypothetical protein